METKSIEKPKRDRRFCAYCGEPKSTKDHVPPAGVFGDLLDSDHSVNLITVPSCDGCNHPESKDDAHFRDALSIAASASPNELIPAAVRAAIRRSIEHAGNEFETPIRNFLRRAQEGWLALDGSMLLQRVKAIPVQWGRIRRTVERTARGLYWHHRGSRLPEGFDVTVIGDKERNTFGRFQMEIFCEVAGSALIGQKRIVHPDVFAYSIAFAHDDPRSAVILLCFYRWVIFMAIIGPAEQSSPIAFA